MSSSRSVVSLALVAVLLAFGSVARADADPARGKTLAYTCLGCHGIPHYKNTYPTYSVPKLEGQHAAYLVAALRGYKSSERSHATMHSHAVSMSEQDMLDIATYFAGTPVKPSAKPIGTPPKSAQVCVSCHGNDGVGITPDYPTLAGQHPDYLARSLEEYKKGARKNPIMAGFVGTLTDADMRELAQYYAKQPGLTTPKKATSRFSAR